MDTKCFRTQGSKIKAAAFILLMLFLMLPDQARAVMVLTNDVQITANLDDETSPAVAYDCDRNDYLVVWTDYRNFWTSPVCGTDIYGKLCTGSPTTTTGAYGGSATTMTCGNDFVISINADGILNDLGTLDADRNQVQPKVAFDCKHKTYLVVWTDTRNKDANNQPYGQIYGQRVGADGTLYGGNFAISTHTDNVDVNQYEPDVIYNSLIYNPLTNDYGKFLVAWVDTSTFDTSANAANSKTITGFNTDGTCNSSTTYSYIPVPAVDHNLIRTAEVDYTGAVTNRQEISQFAFTSQWSHTSGSVSTSWTVYKNEAKPRLSYSAATGENFVAFSGRNFAVDLAATYTTKTDTTTGVVTCSYAAPAFTSTDNDGGATQIKMRKDDGLGLLQDLSLGYNTTKLSAKAPAVSVDPNTNRLLVAWEEPTAYTGGYVHQIYGQLIDLNSFLPYCSETIKITTGDVDRTSPVAAFDNVNQRFFVIWEDARNRTESVPTLDIYGQFIDPQCNLSGSNTLVSKAVGNQLAPAMAFGDVNFRDFFIVFKDARLPGNSDIYGQLFEFSDVASTTGTGGTGTGTTAGLTASPTSLDFGSIPAGTASSAQTVTITNNSGSSQTITAVTRPGAPFNVLSSASTCSAAALASGATCEMIIQFNPTGTGYFTRNITITTASQTLSVALTGTGL